MSDDVVTANEMVGRNVRDLRDERAWTQEELGAAIKDYTGRAWSNKVISFIENGQRQLDPSELLILAAVFDQPVWELLKPNLEDGEHLLLAAGKRGRIAAADARVLVGGRLAGKMASLAAQLVSERLRSLAYRLRGMDEELIKTADLLLAASLPGKEPEGEEVVTYWDEEAEEEPATRGQE
jgi:transcriptional regulator with XRE-family HTH domain